ncbi:MAG: S9 family peptidase [Candidatus Yonathbacteria bacterium]|nr:S9 family peptidase [Candidatus Yonathbacteria bacterium]
MSKNRKEPVVEKMHSITISDPYRWLEDGESPEVKEWIVSHNEMMSNVLRDDTFEMFSDELVKNFKVVNFSNPVPVQGKYFYTERQPEEDQAVLYMKRGLDGKPVVLVNPNGTREGNTSTIDYWTESKSGKYVAYGISEGGNEMATLFVKNTDTNENLSEEIVHCRYSLIQWLPDDSGFFYTRNPRPGTVPKNEEYLHAKVYLHILGGNPDDDVLVFGADRPKDDMLDIVLSPDGKYLAIEVSRTWTENEIYVYDTETKETETLIAGIPAKFAIYFLQEKVLLKTNYNANNYRILQSSCAGMYRHVDEWEDFIPEREFSIKSVHVTKSKILVEYLVNVSSEVCTFGYNGAETDSIPLPIYSGLSGISAREDEEEFFYGVESFIFPKISYRYDPVSGTYHEYQKMDNPIVSEDYTVKQEWYISKDGTRIPMFIVHKKGIELNGENPTLLYGYGGFSSIQGPVFMRNWVPWIERGGIFVVANIRGGGEFGEQWHKDAMNEKKQNSFDDFIAAGEYLITDKYTDKDHLGILGGSNGGLLVAVAGVQRPDLFKAVCSRVPLTDMVRFPLFGIAMRWVHEYGNPEIKEEFERILQWSPFHNVKDDVEYPNFFFTTAEKDTRVDPLHARKMVARLEDVNKHNRVLISVETEAGHGPGKPIAKIVENQALTLSFLSKMLGLVR